MSFLRLIPAVLTGLLIAATATACRKSTMSLTSTVAGLPDTLIPGTFITSPGTYHGREGRYTRTIKLSPAGTQMGWTLTTEVTGTREATESSTSISGMALSSPADPWFVYVESPGQLWLWDGDANLYVALIKGSGHNDYHQLVSGGRLSPVDQLPVPKPVFDRLPESIRRILPTPETPLVRPSI